MSLTPINNYIPIDLIEDLVIPKIISIHYFEYSKDYAFLGESHDFWELLYVDKGEVGVVADQEHFNLHQGNIIFHKPNEWHNVIANGTIAPNLVVIAFECHSPAISYFENKILHITQSMKVLLSTIVNEAYEVYSSDLGDPSLKMLEKNPPQKFGGEQIIKICLEYLLIKLVRANQTPKCISKLPSSIKEHATHYKMDIIINYLKDNIYTTISLDDICKDTLLSKSTLQKAFKDTTGVSVMEYYRNLKIEEAKKMIREGANNFTQISCTLGYNSIHYFSRTFKNVAGMTLSEYSKTLQLNK